MPDSAHGSLLLILHWHFERVICALLMWLPFFSGAIPTYGVLPYAMIGITTLWHLCVHIKIDVAWYSMIIFCVNMKGECDNDARKLIAMMEWCRDLGLHTETFQNTCTLEVVLYEFRHRFGVVIELNYPATLFQEASLHSASNRQELSLDCHEVARISCQHTTHETIGEKSFCLHMFCAIWELCNLEIALCILRIPRLHSNLEIVHYTVDSRRLAMRVFKPLCLDS